MELYIPSVLMLLIAGIVIFSILPNMAPFTLMILAVVILVIAGLQHANLFAFEYATSTWQNAIQGGGNNLLIIMLVLFMIGFLLNMVGGSKISTPSYSRSVPEAPQFGTNTLRSLIRDPFKTR